MANKSIATIKYMGEVIHTSEHASNGDALERIVQLARLSERQEQQLWDEMSLMVRAHLYEIDVKD